jgi:hypothetical protein
MKDGSAKPVAAGHHSATWYSTAFAVNVGNDRAAHDASSAAKPAGSRMAAIAARRNPERRLSIQARSGRITSRQVNTCTPIWISSRT